MTRGWEDSEGVLAAAPERVDELDAAVPGTAVARGTRPGPWMVEGTRSTVLGDELSPLGEATLPGGGTVTWLSGVLGRAANLLIFPGVLRRDFVGPKGTAIESIVVAPTLPLVVRDIRGPGAEAPISLTLTPPGSGESVVVRSGSGLVVHRNGKGIAVTFQPAPHSWEVEPGGPGGEVRVRVAPSGPRSTLLVAGGTADEVHAALAAGAHIRGHALRAASGPANEGVRLETGVSEIDDGFAWARHRLHGLAARSGSEGLWLSLAAQSAGDRELATASLADESMVGSVSEALLAARFASVFGDAGRAGRIARAWVESGADPRSDSVGKHDLGLRALAATSLAEALQYGADAATLAALRRVGQSTAEAVSPDLVTLVVDATPRSSGRALPMAGRPTTPSSIAGWLRGVFAGEPISPVAPGTPAVEAMRLAAAEFRRDPDRAWNQWRAVLDEGGAAGRNGVGIWAPGVVPEIILTLVHGLLGLHFDAPVGRVRLAPILPSHVTTFAVTGIPLGDAALRMEYEASGSTRRYTVGPVAGGVPPLVVFEPSVMGRVHRVRIDGEAADLELRYGAGRTVVPVQFPLDGVRTVEITVD